MKWKTIALSTALMLAATMARVYAAGDYHVPAAVREAAKNQAVYICKLGRAPQSAHGSGCLISPSGLVLTNWHVVVPTLAQGTYRMKTDWAPWWPGGAAGSVVYAAPELDLALVKLDKSPRKNAARLGDAASRGDRIYPVGFTQRAEAPKGLWDEVFPSLGLGRTIDTGEIAETGTYSFAEAVRNPPRGYSREEWTRLLERAEGTLDDAHRRLRSRGESDTWVAFLSNAWTTGGQSGGPCYGEDGRLIALNHGGAWKRGSFLGSAQVPVDLIRLFLVGVQDTGQVHREVVRKFQSLGGMDVIGVPWEPDGKALARASGNGVLQVFRNRDGDVSGIMLRSGSEGASWAKGAIWAYYASKGGPQYIGYPVADEEEASGGRRQRFERGTLYWSRATGQVSKVNASGEPGATASPTNPRIQAKLAEPPYFGQQVLVSYDAGRTFERVSWFHGGAGQVAEFRWGANGKLVIVADTLDPDEPVSSHRHMLTDPRSIGVFSPERRTVQWVAGDLATISGEDDVESVTVKDTTLSFTAILASAHYYQKSSKTISLDMPLSRGQEDLSPKIAHFGYGLVRAVGAGTLRSALQGTKVARRTELETALRARARAPGRIEVINVVKIDARGDTTLHHWTAYRLLIGEPNDPYTIVLTYNPKTGSYTYKEEFLGE